MINIDLVRIDGGTQCRTVLDQQKIAEYAQSMKDGDEFPEIETTFDGSTHWLTDGFHRWHAMKILGVKEVNVKWTKGTLEDAVLAALEANSTHGIPLTNADKHRKVEMCLALPGYDQKSDREIAKICHLSISFVSAHRRPEVKEQQKKNREKSKGVKAGCSPTTPPEVDSIPKEGVMPDEAEIKATEIAEEANRDAMHKLLQSDDALKEAHTEIERLNREIAHLKIQNEGLMNERNSAVNMVKKLQKEIDKLKGK